MEKEKQKHTPGPWEAIYCDGTATDIRDECGDLIAEVNTHANTDNGYVLAGEEFESNAHLIKTAPDLLEACKQSLKELEFLFIEIPLDAGTRKPLLANIHRLERTIAKAEGGE